MIAASPEQAVASPVDTLSALVDRLKRTNARYCILHGWDRLATGRVSDLDMVVAPEDLALLVADLSAPGAVRPIQVIEYEAGSFYIVFGPAEGGDGDLVPVDVCTDYRRDGRIFFSHEQLLEGRTLWNGLWIAAPSAEFRYLVVKRVCKRSISEEQRRRLRDLCAQLGPAGPAALGGLFGPARSAWAMRWLDRGGDGDAVEARRTLRRRGLIASPRSVVRYWVRELPRIVRRAFRPTGVFVAVLGPDGAGKSTLVAQLAQDLARAFRRTAIYHLRPQAFFKGRSGGPVTDPHANAPHGPLRSTLKAAVYGVDYVLGYWRRVRPRLVRSTLVLFDRYVDDLGVDRRRYRYGGPRWCLALLNRVAPRPDLHLLLDAGEEKIFRRKQELGKTELTRQRRAYRDLGARRKNAVLIDASGTPREVARDAREAILDHLSQRALRSRLFRRGGSKPDRAQSSTRRAWSALRVPDGRRFLLPRAPRRAASSALEIYVPQTWRGRAAKAIVRTAARGGLTLLPRLAPESPRPSDELLDELTRILEDDTLTFAVSLASPWRPGRMVIQAISSSGKAVAYAKIGTDESGDRQIRNEAIALAAVADSAPRHIILPDVREHRDFDGRCLLVTAAPRAKSRPAPHVLDERHVRAVTDLAGTSCARGPVQTTALWTRLVNAMERTPPGYRRTVIERGLEFVLRELDGRPGPQHRCHGDFAPWNTRLIEGRLYLFDWEDSEPEAAPATDLIHFLVQTEILLKRRDPAGVLRALLDGPGRTAIDAYLERLGMAPETMPALVVLYALDRVAMRGAADGNGQATRRTLQAAVMQLALGKEPA